MFLVYKVFQKVWHVISCEMQSYFLNKCMQFWRANGFLFKWNHIKTKPNKLLSKVVSFFCLDTLSMIILKKYHKHFGANSHITRRDISINKHLWKVNLKMTKFKGLLLLALVLGVFVTYSEQQKISRPRLRLKKKVDDEVGVTVVEAETEASEASESSLLDRSRQLRTRNRVRARTRSRGGAPSSSLDDTESSATRFIPRWLMPTEQCLYLAPKVCLPYNSASRRVSCSLCYYTCNFLWLKIPTSHPQGWKNTQFNTTVVSYQNESFSSKWELPSCSHLPS